MYYLVAILKDVVALNLLIIDFDFSIDYCMLVVLRRVGLELLDKCCQQFLPNPSLFGVGSVNMRIGLYESKGIDMQVIWSLFFLIFFHRFVVYNL